MIYGIGVDIVRVERIEQSLARFGRRFVDRILHPDEHAEFAAVRAPALYLAKAFAVKEAFGKALGTGVSGFEFKDVGAVRRELGKPVIVMSRDLDRRLGACGIKTAHVSLSDERDIVCAMVVLET
ncbi:MAG: holo-ACP synthase [Gammaproteobacteria bacterium]|nr:holo-ACP synthase [Gammaproteobacteria bacterium]